MTLTNKQEAFCREYLIDLNATQAAIRAGYSEKTAKDIACQNLAKLNIQKRIQTLMEERKNRIEVNADYVLKRLVEIDQMDVLDILTDSGDLRPIKDWPKVWRTTLSGLDIAAIRVDGAEALLKKIKWPDKVKNLELLGKHVSVQAFREQVKNEHDVVGMLSNLMDELSQK
ncbi:terminase small subunit [Arsenophonus nasoniae]|uniref:Terminase small subunit n=1 Tax=Arsenophonus nasoniae TaxID=638 RepID=A0A4P7KQP0_9GAMM|nr:terminase small subunit [Arsenophonus nasoniae]QBY41916.1 Terminase small subunit [Arsenophonus nasoniae]WGM00371.1 terminase small subunit [Arsenophonus nasoniae]WGM01918.1 terminase small subunit [Arsenophonus nasoniae]WGM06126.1 terminase small subunit [Arsenophonus nasoniae]WGM11088.1 terminase small subunit [Arsenophonus nasoniae]